MSERPVDCGAAADTIRRALEHAGRNDWSDEPPLALEALDSLVVEVERLTRERERLIPALEELLDVGERSRSGDPSLNPEAWYAARDFARVVLKEAGAVSLEEQP